MCSICGQRGGTLRLPRNTITEALTPREFVERRPSSYIKPAPSRRGSMTAATEGHRKVEPFGNFCRSRARRCYAGSSFVRRFTETAEVRNLHSSALCHSQVARLPISTEGIRTRPSATSIG